MIRSHRAPTLLVGQSLELWRAPAGVERAWVIEAARRQLEAGAHALDLNAGVRGNARTLVDAARWASEAVHPRRPALFLDTGTSGELAEALRLLTPLEGPTAITLNAVALTTSDERPLLEAVARAGTGAVLSPRALDAGTARPEAPPEPVEGHNEGPASAEHLAHALREGERHALEAGVAGPLFLDALAYPPALDLPRWRRSVEVTRLLREASASPLVAVGNVGHRAPPRLRPWLRLIYLALALGAGARALILPVEERTLLEATELIEGVRQPVTELDRWLLEFARGAAEGSWALPSPPTSAPPALLEAFTVCRG